jgi:serine phosphatase RsbU (regulator of sigma subunit)
MIETMAPFQHVTIGVHPVMNRSAWLAKALGAFFFVISLLSAGMGAPLEKLYLDQSFSSVDLTGHLEYLEDREGGLVLDDFLSARSSVNFSKLGSQSPIRGFTSSAYWARFTVRNTLPGDFPWYLEISSHDCDFIELYGVRGSEVTMAKKAGDQYPFSARDVHFRTFAFSLNEKAGTVSTYYVRLQTRSSLELLMTAWSPGAFRDKMSREQILFGLFYGAILIMILYNLVLFGSMRDRNYLYYVLFFLAYLFFQLGEHGLAFQYLWPRGVWWANNSLPMFIFFSIIFVVLFTRSFLNIRDFSPRYDRLFLFVLIFSLAHLPFSFVIGYSYAIRIAIATVISASIINLVAAVLVLYRGYRPARYYIIAWLFFFVMIILYSLQTFTVIPYSVIMVAGPQVASLFVIVLMSLALADRMNFMRKGLESFTSDLEKQVSLRTEELNGVIRKLESRDRVMQVELDLAGTIQKGLLPGTPFYSDGIRIVAHYRSMEKVGGDFYDFFTMQGGHLGVLIADASGHGMPAAFITALAKISFSEAMQTSIFPAEILSSVNDNLVEAIKTDDFVTAFLLVLSPTFEAFYCNASHQKPLLLRYGSTTVETWDTNGLFLGALMKASEMYEDGRDYLDYGDRIFLYTDGMVDAAGPSGEKFGETRLSRVFVETAALPFDEAMHEITRQWEEFVAATEASDDVTFLLVEIDAAYRKVAEHREQGFRLLNAGEYQEAISELEKALEINPLDEKTHLYIGECYMNYGNYPGVVTHLEAYLKNNDVDANVWHHLAKAYFILGDYNAAGRASRKATQLRVNHIEAHILYGLSMKNVGNHDEAERAWNRILRIDPENTVAKKELKNLGRDH